MKKLLIILSAIILLAVLIGCSEKDDNITDIQTQGYKLDQFINQAIVTDSLDAAAPDTLDFRGLFAYEIVSGEDGFSPRMSSYAGYDLNWETFKNGYLVPSENNRTWFADTSLPGAFRVRNTGYFRMYRKIDVIAPDNSTKMIELKGLALYTINNWDGNPEEAIKLSDLVQGIASYDSVCIVCSDDFGLGRYYTQAAIDDGYYLLTTERTIFPTVSLPSNMQKLKKVSYLKVYGTEAAQSFTFELTPTADADMIFTVPENLTGYSLTTIPGYSE